MTSRRILRARRRERRRRVLRLPALRHAHRRRRDRRGRRALRRARDTRRGARPHELVGVALSRRARGAHRARYERRRARREPAGASRGSCTTSTPIPCCRSTTTRSTTRRAASRSTTSRDPSTCSAMSRASCAPGGLFVCTFSNRLFPTKAIRGWLHSESATHQEIVAGYFARRRRIRTCTGATMRDAARRRSALRGMGAGRVGSAR